MDTKFDDAVLQVFLEKQEKLFPKPVAATKEEARDYLADSMAVVVDTIEDVLDYLDGLGMDISETSEEEILTMEEVFPVGDGRYLIVDV